MNFNEAIAAVLALTSRPDKASYTAQAINEAISFCTLLGEFRNDMIETSINVSATLYGASISISTLTRFRRFLYVKPYGKYYYLNPIGQDKLFTPKGNMQPDAYFIAGTSLTYTLSELNTSLLIGYLSRAAVLDTVTVTTHWMLTEIPYAIINLAAAKVFQEVGDDASYRSFDTKGMDMFHAFRNDHDSGD